MDGEGEADKGSSKKDFAWVYTVKIEGEKYFRCKFCNQQCSGTIFRFKNHLAGTHKGMKSCLSAPREVVEQCKKALEGVVEIKNKRNAVLNDIREVASQSGDQLGMKSSQTLVRGPMDSFATSTARQSTLNSNWKKTQRKELCRLIGRFFFSAGLPFNACNDPYYMPMFEAAAKFGDGFVPPSMHEMRTWILKAEVDDIDKLMEEHKTAWKQYGCSIMSDGWTDGKNRYLINFLVNSPAGTWFLRSVDASDTIKNGELLSNYLNKVIDEVGEENVVQVITDNGSNYVNAGKRLMETRKNLYWTPCAAHCIDLMLEDIGKMKIHQTTLAKAKQVVKFIYGHTWVLDLMRKFTKNNEILRPAITRFATAYLTLQSIYKQKQALQSMFSSQEWQSCAWIKKTEGMKAQGTVLFDRFFWGHVKYCIQSVIPLVSVLREVDSEERPAMAFIYELMDTAKEKIAFNCGNNEKKYLPIWKRIDDRWASQLHKPLHAAGYYLNPQLRFDERFSSHEEVKDGLYQCMERMLNYKDRLKADVQLDFYDNVKGDFGSRIAIDSRKLRSPGDWWMRFGSKTPELTNFAVRVLSLTCSSSGCERNWSTFERIYTKKRNRLEHKRLNALVYVMYNTRLRERSIKRKTKNIDPITIDEIDSDDEWIAEKEDPIFPNDASWIDDENLFEVDAIRRIPVATYDREGCSRPPVCVNSSTIPSPQREGCSQSHVSLDPNATSSSQRKKRKIDSGKGKKASFLVDEDTDEEELEEYNEIGGQHINQFEDLERGGSGINEVGGKELGVDDEDNELEDETFDSD